MLCVQSINKRMERKILLLLMILFSTTGMAKWTLVPKYSAFISVENKQDSLFLESDKTSLYYDDSMFRIGIVHETLTLNRIKYIRRQETYAGWFGFFSVISSLTTMSNNWVTRLRGRALTYSNAVLSGICNYNVSAARKLAIDACIENVTDEELLVVDMERGLVWYVQPRQYLCLSISNPDVANLRVSDIYHKNVKFVTIGAGSTLKDVNIEWENENYWVFPLQERTMTGAYVTLSYFLKDKYTGEQREITKEEFKKLKKK